MAGRDIVLLSGGSRLAGDEPNAEYIPSDVVITSASQGGFKTLDCSLMRSASTTALERMYGTVTLLDEDGEILWNGELRRPDPATIARSVQTQTPQALGWQAVAEDREDVMFLGIDRGLEGWQGPSLDRRLDAVSTPLSPRDPQSRGGVLQLDVSGAWDTDRGRPWANATYSAAPLNIGRLIWGSAVSVNMSGGHWIGEITAQPGLSGGGTTVTPDWFITDSGDQGPFDWDIDNRVAEIIVYTGLSSATEYTRTVDIKDLCVIGDHGLPLQGYSAAEYGLLASDMVRHLIGKFGEGVLQPGYIPATTAPIGHFTQMEHGTLGQAVNAINAFHGYTSAVWENGLWDFHSFGQSPRAKTWQVAADDIELKSAGLDGSMLWSGLIVTYTEPGGERRSVGPPGSIADEHDERLELTDPTHPCVAEGKRRWCRLNIDSPVMKETAVFAGAVCLSERNQARRAGTATVVGRVLDRDAGVMRPAHRMRGGDLLVITGRGDDSPHRIVESSGTPALELAELTLDDTRAQSDLFLAHLQAQLTGRL